MRMLKVLEMLNDGKIEELKKIVQDEIYKESLKGKPNAKKRYTAMKKYFTYVNQAREVLQKPGRVTFEDKEFTCFTNSWSLALTTESTGEIELYDEANGKYPDVNRLIRFDGIKGKLDINEVIAQAKAKGYKLNKTEVNRTFKYLLYYDGTYYKLGLLDATHAIINDGEPVMTYHPDGNNTAPLTFTSSLGMAVIMPIRFENEDDAIEDHIVVIEIG